MNSIYLYDIAAMGTTLVLLLSYTFRNRIPSDLSKGFLVYTTLVLVSSTLDFITLYFFDTPEAIPLWCQYVLNIIYLLCYNGISVAFTYCIIFSNRKNTNFSWIKQLLICLPYFYAFFVIITTSHTKAIFYFTENLEYKHGILFYSLFGIGFFYVVFLICYFIKHKKQIPADLKFAFFFHSTATYCTLILQIFISDLYLIGFMTAITALLLFLAIEDPSNYTDVEMGIFNLTALKSLLELKFLKRRKFQILAFEIEGFDTLEKNIGIKNKLLVLKRMGSRFSSIAGKKSVFRISQNKIAIVIPDDNTKQKFMLNQISNIINDSYEIDNIKVYFSTTITSFVCPDAASNTEEVLELINISLQKNTKNPTSYRYSNIVYGDIKFLEEQKRTDMILNLIKNTIANKRIVVHYQPIYSATDHAFTAAQAQLFLNSKELGLISAREYKPIAIQHGLIIDLEDLFFNFVCTDISENKIFQTGIKSIHLVFSEVFWQNEHFADKIKNALTEYHMDCSTLVLGVNERDILYDNQIFLNNLAEFNKAQIKTYLNNYGQNFANKRNMAKYNFDFVKLNPELVYYSIDSKLSKDLLLNTLKIIEELKKEPLVPGIETESHKDMVLKMNCNYLQGNYFAKYMLLADFMEFFK